MKKIGLLSAHYADNYGSILLSYALYKTINKFEDIEAEIINYIPKGFKYSCGKVNLNYQRLYEKRRDKFNSFLSKNCALEDAITDISWEKYDGICIGSGQVWNPQIMMQRGCFYTYLLPFENRDIRKISYGSSIGILKENKDFRIEDYKRYLSGFHSISVREKCSALFLKEELDRDIECVIDSTMLLTAEEYEKLLISKEGVQESYIFFYWVNLHNIHYGIEFVNTVARKYRLKIIHNILDIPEFAFCNEEGSMFFSGPTEFLWYVKNASIVVTDSFHGGVFSILFHRPFYIFAIGERSSRIYELIEKFELENRLVKGYVSSNDIDIEICWDKIDKCLFRERKHAYEYLERALKW